MNEINSEKQLAALEAVKEIKDGMIVGLGTGSTAYFAIQAVGELVKNGMQLQTIPTSEQTKQMSINLGIPMIDINSVESIDITIDGADEFTANLELIKGGGGALLREKIVASLTQKQIIITDSSKQVQRLGKFKLPIEVIPMATSYVQRQLKNIGGEGFIRWSKSKEYLTDQGNYIIDADFGLIDNPSELDKQLNNIVGIVEHGLFINIAHKIIMSKDRELVIFEA